MSANVRLMSAVILDTCMMILKLTDHFYFSQQQLDEDKQQFLSRWLPDKLSPNIRLCVSMIEGTPTHQMLRAYKPSPREVICGPLDMDSRKVRMLLN